MADDYRNTKYCPEMGDIKKRKDSLAAEIQEKHSRAEDMHALVSKNNQPYKRKFVEVYHRKCAYCGVSIEILPLRMFEIDHFIYEKSPRFHKSKAAAGYMENLVLACYYCNRPKGDFEIPPYAEQNLHPDYEGITHAFVRDKQYYIQISEENKDDQVIKEFYNRLQLGKELRRVDYLLMSMKGLYNKIKQSGRRIDISDMLLEAINLLQSKRNVMELHTDIS